MRALRLFPLALAALAACAVPLGPGFDIEQQSYELHLLTDGTPRLHVRASYRLRNAGDRPLESIETLLPDAALSGRRNLRLFLDGRELPPQSPESAEARSVTVPLAPPWPRKARHELVLEYDLAPAAPGHAGVAVSEQCAHLRHFGWFPELRPPEHMFEIAGKPEKYRFSVRVPQGYTVLAAGKSKGVRRSAGETEYRFEMDVHEPGPFLVAGRYAESRVETSDGTVIFWTLAPLDPAAAQQAGARIAASYKTFEGAFGRVERRHDELWLVETPARLVPESGGENEAPAGIGFPEGALLNSRAFALGVSSEEFLDLVEHELAHAWFGQALKSRPDAGALLVEGLAEYAVLVAAESRGGDAARRRQAALLLRWYDEHAGKHAEKPLISLRPSDPYEQRAFGYSKGALFFVALEDEVGKDAVRRGLARLAHALTGKPVGLFELRAAIEGEAGRDLADFFRAWLNRTGIPDGFRSRYEIKAGAGS